MRQSVGSVERRKMGAFEKVSPSRAKQGIVPDRTIGSPPPTVLPIT